MKKLFVLFVAAIFMFGCAGEEKIEEQEEIEELQYEIIERESKIPFNATKMTPETDFYPPILHSDEWQDPVPVEGGVNTKGGEDSAFVTPDGKTLYFFFTPDVSVPVEEQVTDGVTGIYVSKKVNGEWGEAERVFLQDPGKLSLDGCEFVQGNEMWFCSAREGYTGVHWFTAEYDREWKNWEYADEKLNDEYMIGEMHITANGKELYFHRGEEDYDIWITRKNGEWGEPERIDEVNSDVNEGWPFLTQDGNELWITRWHMGSPAIFRSIKVNGTWSEPELIISQFAGEASLDNEGNIYFTHHFYEYGEMIEADIYVAKKS